ncbi:MAG: ABC transporter permease subunit [Thermoprotei archaeon]|nr:ABC transporter permease subunit [Thermoprotei archaeon]
MHARLVVAGASDFQVFRRVVLPLSLPGIISASVLQFAWVWNDFFALVLIFDPSKMVITQMLPRLKGQYHGLNTSYAGLPNRLYSPQQILYEGVYWVGY